MQSYRLYRLDGAGKIVSADWIEAIGDEAALTQARAHAQMANFELWERGRLVSRETSGGPRRS